ncbi:uncharacterized protein BDV17DRAFT_280747 [Aspergillus undulatus]|uniref:uncharacterized protein n=1 Tax=Aspergillus undulatus TaxID=1810928 RepID=UPI003CCCFE07
MPPKKDAPGRKKDAIHFVNARPASETERLNIKRMVRAHVGKWISTQTKDRAAGSAVVVDPQAPALVASAETPDAFAASQAFELDSDDPYLPSTATSSTLSPASSSSSRTSPESCASNSSHTAIPIFTAPPHSQSELTVAVLPPRTVFTSTNFDTCHLVCDGREGCQCDCADSDTPSPPLSGDYIETVGAGRLDPFRVYGMQYEPEMIRSSEEYCLTCLWPGLTPGPSGTNMQSWFPMSLSDPTLFTAFLFGSLSHMRVQALNGWIPKQLFHSKQQRLLERVEMETIKMVSREMDNPTRAVSDAIIWSVVCMAHNKADDNLPSFKSNPFTAPMQRLQWLDVYGSLPPNLVHIGGLIQMINLRGGIDKIQLPGLASVISFSDIVTSSTFLSRTVFPFVPLEPSRKGLTMQELLGYTTDMVGQYHAYFQHLGIPRSLAEVICAMNTYTALVDHCLEGKMSYDPSLLADQRNLLHYTFICLPAAGIYPDQSNIIHNPQPQPQDIVYEVFRLAIFIYSVGVILPLPAQSTPLAKLAELLHNILRSAPYLSLWDAPQAQIVFLWILALGAIAATDTPYRGWYIQTLWQVIRRNRITSYDDLQRYLAFVAWYPVACDKPGLELWEDLQKTSGASSMAR